MDENERREIEDMEEMERKRLEDFEAKKKLEFSRKEQKRSAHKKIVCRGIAKNFLQNIKMNSYV